MQGTTDGFSYGLITPVAAFLMACLGGALGLRCAMRSLHTPERGRKAGWLVLAATSIGSGVWTMHFIAMMGFAVAETPVAYDRATTFASLALAIVMVGVGIFIVGYRGTTTMALVTGGTVTGLGIASMHYLGMAGIRLEGRVEYDTVTVGGSVAIAVVAATTALWAAASVHGLLMSLAASLAMGIAVTGMHYMGMAAVHVHLWTPYGPAGGAQGAQGADNGESAVTLLGPMLVGPGVFLLLAAVVVIFDPLMVTGGRRPGPVLRDRRWGRDRQERALPGVPDQRDRREPTYGEGAGEAVSGPSGGGSRGVHDW
ncbi:MHYT domain-containing protein [Streptomyces sp. NBC_01506]|uniref:MHYT domain-containing protein n=1 Tax=Streptomyces sp. NBC_01506 TaxID=2903887 RepID=UPI00386B0741